MGVDGGGERAVLVYEEGDVSVLVDGSPRSVELVLEDARRQGEESFYLRSGGVPVLFRADIPWEVCADGA